MPALLKLGIKKESEHGFRQDRTDHPLAEAEHVCVVVSPCHLDLVPQNTVGGTNPSMSVGRHGHPDAAAAHKDTTFGPPSGDLPGYPVCKIGIIGAFSAEATGIMNFMPALLEPGDDMLLELKSCVIGTHRDFHIHPKMSDAEWRAAHAPLAAVTSSSEASFAASAPALRVEASCTKIR